jgi:hypothetical protein
VSIAAEGPKRELSDFDPACEREESKTLDFKASFDPSRTADWCELIKDIVAMANSGGGRIVIGCNDDGTPSGVDPAIVLGIDPADIVNKVHKYTGKQFADFALQAVEVDGQVAAMLVIGGVRFPIIFTAPGEYEIATGKPKSAFRVGTIYFRHGAKSEPGTTEDLREALERELSRVKEFWLEGIAKVVHAPEGSRVEVVKAVSLDGSDGAQPFRLSHTAEGPEFKVIETDRLYPHRTKEMLKKLAEMLGPKTISSHDLLLIRRAHNIDTDPNFSYKGMFGTRQYSDAFVEWIVASHSNDKGFMQKIREEARRAQKKN